MRRQNVDVLLKVRSARESTALAELGVQRHEVNGLQMQLEEATSNLAQLVMSGARNVNHAKNLATLRSSSAACLRQITDSLLLAQLREREARERWIVANREKEIGQELVDRQVKADSDEATRVAHKETEDLSRGRLIVRSSTSDGGESS
jgi:hypothetical protein